MTDASAPSEQIVAAEARALMRKGLKAALATCDSRTGAPYASLIAVATESDGTPLFLISTLARHTRNLLEDDRASLLFDGTDGLGDPLEGGRLSVFGRARTTACPRARRRFLVRHPAAGLYADFGDFAFYGLAVEGAHFVGGFGRIHDLGPRDLLTGTDDADALLEAEEGVVAHMNEDHADAVALYATRLLGAEEGPWRLAGCDPEGCDLVLGQKALRLNFPERVTGPGEIRKALVALTETARQSGPA